MTSKMELLAPAGSPEALDAAVGEGADAVYLGLKSFNARMRSANFAYSQFEGALRALRRMGKKIYVTVNTVFEQREADRMFQLLKYLAAAGPDALIVQDFGVVAMARSEFPSLKLHASTQMNIASGRGANALSRHGVSRVVLARELSLAELRGVRAETNMELEVFVHGALCVSASGLCLFSSFLGGKSANRGMCTQACRRLYHRNVEKEGRSGRGVPDTGYYFSPGDLQLLESLPELADAGVNAIKIEGRMKSADYVGAVVSAYRLVLDAVAEGGEEAIAGAVRQGQDILRNDFARAKTRFYFDMGASVSALTSGSASAVPKTAPGGGSGNWLNPAQDGGTGVSLGAVLKVRGSGDERQGLIAPGVILSAGDTIRMHRSDDSERVSHKLVFAEQAGGDEKGYWVSIPDGFNQGDRAYLIQTRSMSKRYDSVIARNLSGGHSPGREKAPFPALQITRREETGGKAKRASGGGFPEGVYAAVSQINDLYVLQSCRPVKVMLAYTRKTVTRLLADNAAPLPFRPAEIILVLDPFFPQGAAENTAAEIGQLVEKGYYQFEVNNLGHFSLFRDLDARSEIRLIAGPWLYMFNAWSFSFIASLGVDGFVSPLENNRQNLERTLGGGDSRTASRARTPERHASIKKPVRDFRLRSLFFVPVFAWPPLFRIRADLGPVYDFNSFSDNRNENFSLVTGPGGSQVIPEKPFSIVDKIPFLKEAGFCRFIIDLSGPVLKKADYRDLMRAVQEGAPLPRISRFNWKDGFFQSEN